MGNENINVWCVERTLACCKGFPSPQPASPPSLRSPLTRPFGPPSPGGRGKVGTASGRRFMERGSNSNSFSLREVRRGGCECPVGCAHRTRLRSPSKGGRSPPYEHYWFMGSIRDRRSVVGSLPKGEQLCSNSLLPSGEGSGMREPCVGLRWARIIYELMGYDTRTSHCHGVRHDRGLAPHPARVRP